MLKYRPEIDGLRALAVFAVIFYHAKFSLFSGGFIGVDVFFAISGYLITGIIIKDISDKKFSLLEFYERRIRRIVPALYTVLIFTFLVSFFLLLPDEFTVYTESLQWLLAFLSNIFFSNTLNYFNPTGETFPLLHTWSLSVEEQFYFVFPIFLVVLYRRNRKFVVPFCVFATLISFNFSSILPSNTADSSKQFFYIYFRAWELLLGALCAVFHESLPCIAIRKKILISNLLTIFGLVGIVYSFILLDGSKNPSEYAFIAILSTCLILLFADTRSNTTFVGIVLKNKVCVFLGLMSYSLYLWHQPLFAFAKINFGELSKLFYLFLIILSIIVSYFSYMYIESPFRNKNFLQRKNIYILWLVTTLSLAAIPSYINTYQKEYQMNTYSSDTDKDLFIPKAVRGAYVWARHNEFAEVKIDEKLPFMVVIGDSQAGDFLNIVKESQLFDKWKIRTILIPAVCQINFDEDRFDFIEEKNHQQCSGTIYNPKELARITEQADIVIFASAWKTWASKKIKHTIDNIKSFEVTPKEGRKIFLIGSKAVNFSFSHMELIRMGNERKKIKISLSNVAKEQNKILNQQDAYHAIDMISMIFDNNIDNIPLTTPEGFIIYYDNTHLTQKGAAYFGKKLSQSAVFSELINHKP